MKNYIDHFLLSCKHSSLIHCAENWPAGSHEHESTFSSLFTRRTSLHRRSMLIDKEKKSIYNYDEETNIFMSFTFSGEDFTPYEIEREIVEEGEFMANSSSSSHTLTFHFIILESRTWICWLFLLHLWPIALLRYHAFACLIEREKGDDVCIIKRFNANEHIAAWRQCRQKIMTW